MYVSTEGAVNSADWWSKMRKASADFGNTEILRDFDEKFPWNGRKKNSHWNELRSRWEGSTGRE